ncbi:Phosphatidylinositol 4-phosphate 5-kinase 9 [Tetrabaena socialis]|uniref:1-phosphatidylinositol-4-phosphate 5-kinase n=1 Tax=Tetrabaena socialis TaxID=47790 RepID=A0A2J8AJF2_9CHLO|nr:Phosphatidylinositol 4-phosphate 5-kinase 9 [Tetrabaena socialis]|eukprot:PNH12633.1 Phosphatidylinositol 4-phosphate 5-kinase 9 [Tetrabaena socialis]
MAWRQGQGTLGAITPAHPSGDFKWKDYSPRVFRNLRNMYGIADAEYMLSLGGSSALWQLNSPGKSGCMFFLSDDERFLVKTMRKTEIRTLIDMLPQYYRRCRQRMRLHSVATDRRGDPAPEEVVLCFGIIDILQDWNARKVFERTFKSMTHDSYAISVAPPKLYSMRFADFLTKSVFMDPAAAAAKGLYLPPPTISLYGTYAPGFTTIEEERDSSDNARRR